MKTRILGATLFALLAASVYGQTALRANIPFDFQAGPVRLAAGQYDISQVSLTSAPHVWMIRDTAGKPGAFLTVRNGVLASQPSPTSKLVFHRYGKAYFLSQIHLQGRDLGWEFAPSARERELAKAANSVETASVKASQQ